jgi:hypothetical protein
MATSARKLTLQNPDLSRNQMSSIDVDYVSGSSLTLIQTTGFMADDILVASIPGSEKASSNGIVSVDSITGLTLFSSLNYSYSKGTPVYKSVFDQIEISYMVGAVWTILDTINIQWDQRDTVYFHQGGIDGTQYRYRFLNSMSGNYSEYSNTITGAGFNKYQMGYIVKNVRKVILDPERRIVSDAEIIRFINEARDIIVARTPPKGWWFWKKTDEGTITTTAATFKYDLDTISDRIEYIKDVRYFDIDANTLYQLEYKSESEFDELIRDQDRDDDDSLTCYTISPPDTNSTSGYLKVYPTPEHTKSLTEGGMFYIRYYEPDDTYDDASDSTSIPLPYILEDYAVAQCFKLKGLEERAVYYEEKFFGAGELRKRYNAPTGINLLESMNSYKGRSMGQPKSIKRYVGRNPLKRLFGNTSGMSQDDYRERYW